MRRKNLTVIQNRLLYERIGLATEKSDILTDLPLNNSGTITGDSKMKHIPLTQGKFAIVDDELYEWLIQWDWYAWWSGYNWYVRRSAEFGEKKFMHREILKAKKGEVTDHINNNSFDNRQCNIRICTNQQNIMNSRPSIHSSIYKGVYWHKKANKWSAQIRANGKRNYLGLFIKEKDAAIAYDRAAIEYFKEYAWLNF